MDRLVDTHCHILPEVDDGAKNMEETRQMLQEAYEDGIRYIIATPHHHPRRGRKSPKQLRRQLKLVREEAAQISDELRIYLGTEIYFQWYYFSVFICIVLRERFCDVNAKYNNH